MVVIESSFLKKEKYVEKRKINVWTKIMSKEKELMKGKCDKRQLQYDN
jgi:hypothetical protein